MNLVSSHQLFDQDLNVFKLGENTKLGNELRAFFKDCQNDYLWELWTDRQKITKALRHTESIQLRYLTGVAQGATTIKSTAANIFLVQNQNNVNILTVSQSGIIVVATQSVELSSPAPNGGIYFTSNSLFIGID
jgi:hypothetical protein